MKTFKVSTQKMSFFSGAFRLLLPLLMMSFAQQSLANYSATISPLNVPLNTPTVFTMVITSSVNQMGAIQISVPAGISGPVVPGDVSLTPPAGKLWYVSSVTPTLISIRAQGTGSSNRLDMGESIQVVFTASITSAGGKVFTTQAFTTQNFTGNGVGVFTGNPPTLNENPACPVATDRLYVDAAATGGTGGSWTCAMKELSDAIAIANANLSIKSIWVAKGTYKTTTGSDRNAAMTITRGDLKILGGFNSGDMSEGAANPTANVTSISGDIGAMGDATDNSYHIMVINGVPVAAPLMIDGFVFRAGNASGAGTFLGSGGAIFAYDNNDGTTVAINRCVFMQNSSLTYGGAVYTSRSNLTVTACIFTGNSSASGGAAYGFFSSPKISKTAFVNNTATYGGGYYGNFGATEFSACVFSGNTASMEAGAVYQNQANMSYFDCLFANNGSMWSGAIHQLNASASTVVNSTFYANTASQANNFGAGAIFLGYNNCTTSISNSIFYKNMNNGADNVANADIKNTYGTSNTVSYSMLQMNTMLNVGASNVVGMNPTFVNEASPVGGDAQWFTNDDGLRLAAGSPAINSGDNGQVALYSLITDLLGNPRTVCTTVDRGAIEYQTCNPPVAQLSKRNINQGVTGVIANPFSSDLQVRYTGSEKATLIVFDVSGKPRYNNNNIQQGITHIDAGAWGKGMYQVVLKTESGKQEVFKAMKL